MKSSVRSVKPQTSLGAIMNLFHAHPINRVPVLDADGTLRGTVSPVTFLTACAFCHEYFTVPQTVRASASAPRANTAEIVRAGLGLCS